MNDSIFLSFILTTNPGIKGIIITESFRKGRFLFNETLGTIENQNKENIEKICKRADLFELQLKNGSRLFAFPLNRNYICGHRSDFVITDIGEERAEMRQIILPLIVANIIKIKGKMQRENRLQFIYNLNNETLCLF